MKPGAVQPTLLLDEADASFGGDLAFSELLRGILNTGFQRGGNYSMCGPIGTSGWAPMDCATFCAKAIAGIGDSLPETVASRSIPIRMKRKLPHESVERFRRRDVLSVAEPLQAKTTAWAASHVGELQDARPSIPSVLGDRAADMWEPLLAIADLAGGEWPTRARASAARLSVRQRATESIGVKLLRDIRRTFDGERMTSWSLVQALLALEDAPWGLASREWGREFEVRALARLLEQYDIAPKTLRFGEHTKNGYERFWFEDAWTRFLPSENRNRANSVNGYVVHVDDVDASHTAAQASWEERS